MVEPEIIAAEIGRKENGERNEGGSQINHTDVSG
jgi:hypothetical protein